MCDFCGDQACNAFEYTADEAAAAEMLALHFAYPMGYTAPLQPMRPDADGVFRIRACRAATDV